VLKLHQNYCQDSKTKTKGGYERLLQVTRHGCTFLSRAIKKKPSGAGPSDALCTPYFFYSDGIVAHIPVPEHTSVTGTFYKNTVLSEVVRHYTAKRPHTGLRGVKLLHDYTTTRQHDNAPAHRSAVVTEYLQKNNIETLPHRPYSPHTVTFGWIHILRGTCEAALFLRTCFLSAFRLMGSI